jgi:hypothetical protein
VAVNRGDAECPSLSAKSPNSGFGDWRGKLVGEPDHIHILLSLPPNLDQSRFVNNSKTTSSRLIRDGYAAIRLI